MTPFFSSRISRALDAGSTLFAFDFDGTLAPIVADPDKAYAAGTTEALLQELTRYASVAIVSGRSLRDLKDRIRFAPKYLVGNHGLEGVGAGEALRRAKAECRKWKRNLLRSGIPEGAILEDKRFTLTLHYRNCRDPQKAGKSLARAISRLTPAPRVIPGKWVFNLMPTKRHHKGIAVVHLRKKAGAKHVLYVGDDHTDEDVFRMKDRSIISVRVGRRQGSKARYFIEKQSDIDRLLRSLLRIARDESTSASLPRSGKARRIDGTLRRTRSELHPPRPAAHNFLRKRGKRFRTAHRL